MRRREKWAFVALLLVLLAVTPACSSAPTCKPPARLVDHRYLLLIPVDEGKEVLLVPTWENSFRCVRP